MTAKYYDWDCFFRARFSWNISRFPNPFHFHARFGDEALVEMTHMVLSLSTQCSAPWIWETAQIYWQNTWSAPLNPLQWNWNGISAALSKTSVGPSALCSIPILAVDSPHRYLVSHLKMVLGLSLLIFSNGFSTSAPVLSILYEGCWVQSSQEWSPCRWRSLRASISHLCSVLSSHEMASWFFSLWTLSAASSPHPVCLRHQLVK